MKGCLGIIREHLGREYRRASRDYVGIRGVGFRVYRVINSDCGIHKWQGHLADPYGYRGNVKGFWVPAASNNP